MNAKANAVDPVALPALGPEIISNNPKIGTEQIADRVFAGDPGIECLLADARRKRLYSTPRPPEVVQKKKNKLL